MTVVGTLPFRRVDLGPIRGSTTALLRERGREWLEESSPVRKCLGSGSVFFLYMFIVLLPSLYLDTGV